MIITKLIRYLQGVTTFTILGFYGEKFLSLCNKQGLKIWDIRPTPEGFTAKTYPRIYKKLKPLAKKCGVRIRVSERRGVPFFLWNYRTRRGLFIGFILILALLYLLSGRIWRIEIEGNENISEEEIVYQLAQIGIKPGVSHRDLDALILEKQMLINMEELSFIAINFRGSSVYIELTEFTPPPAIEDDHTKPQNIVAMTDGVITRVEVYEGQAVVAVGDTVAKGDILISGITRDGHDNALIRKASGVVLAKTEEEIKASIAYEQDDYIPQGEEEEISFIEVFGVRIPLGRVEEKTEFHTIDEQKETVTLFGVALPINKGSESYTFWEPKSITLSAEQAKDYCLSMINEREAEYGESWDIISRTLSATEGEEGFDIVAKYRVVRDIATPLEIVVED